MEVMSYVAALGRFFRGLGRGLDRLRKTLHLIFLLLLAVFVLAVLLPQVPHVPRAAALLISPQGMLVEELSGEPVARALARAQGLPFAETLLQDLIDAIRLAKDDERIRVLVLELDGLGSAGLSKLEELAAEVRAFRDSGKPVVAIGDDYSRNQYYLAAQADHVFMHPMGFVLIEGYNQFLPYYKSLLDKLYVDYNVWTVGEYKSFVEPVTRDDMSPEDREATEYFLHGIWDAYQRDVTDARQLGADALQRYADDAGALLAAAGGDTGRMALEYGLVDELLTRDAVRERLRDLVGADDNGDAYAHIRHDEYLRARRAGPEPRRRAREKVAVIRAVGTILDGSQGPGTIGGDSTAALIREAANDDDVKALVLRVDSPGGSAFASEVILREVEVFRDSGRPVVVSMSSVAASGGYWISMAADQIWASRNTLTGSIGVGATLPTFQRSLAALGVHIDGVSTTELADPYDLTRELSEPARELIGHTVEYVYDEFVTKVAEHRGRSVEEIDEAARGRVWTGAQAFERGLVDELGRLDDAIRAAAGLAGLAEDAYRIEYLSAPLGFAQRLAMEFARVGGPLIGALGVQRSLPAGLKALLEASAEPIAFFERLNDPRGIYAYCLCDVR
jgi:protease IV